MSKPISSQRIAAVDLIRGYFLFAIIIDHLGRFFGVYDLLTGRGTQWVSAAEGFFFISGLMIGLVRARKLADQPFIVSVKKVWARAGILYIWAVILTLLFTLLAQHYTGQPGLKAGAFHNESFGHLIAATLSLRYAYGWADYLVYYVLYLLFTPIAIWLLRRRLWPLLLALSFAIWLLGKNFQLTWQLLFFGGSIVGYYLTEIEDWFHRLTKRVRRGASGLIVSLTGLTIISSFFLNTVVDSLYHHRGTPHVGLPIDALFRFNLRLAPWFDKSTLAPGRLLLFMLWFCALYIIVRRYEATLARWVGAFFIPFGQNSLYVYIVHGFFVFYTQLIFPRSTPVILNFIINTLVLGLIWLMLRYKFLFKLVPR